MTPSETRAVHLTVMEPRRPKRRHRAEWWVPGAGGEWALWVQGVKRPRRPALAEASPGAAPRVVAALRMDRRRGQQTLSFSLKTSPCGEVFRLIIHNADTQSRSVRPKLKPCYVSIVLQLKNVFKHPNHTPLPGTAH